MNFVQFLVFSNATEEGLFNLSGLNRGLKLWKGPCVGDSCCTLVAHVKQVLIEGGAGIAVYRQLWIFIWKKNDFVGQQVHGKKLLIQWPPCVEPEFPAVNKSFYLRGVLNGHAIQPLFSQVWKLVWPSCGSQRQVEVNTGLGSLQTEGQKLVCSQVAGCALNPVSAGCCAKHTSTDREISQETHLQPVLSVMVWQADK